jgi:hypothetical protein
MRTKAEKAAYDKKWREENRDQYLALRKKHNDANKKKTSEYCKTYYQKNKEKKQALSLKRYYGITVEDYNRMFEEQKGICPGCTRHQSELNHPLHVDHCHVLGHVRGLLCRDCNNTLGFAKDNPSILKNLINYLTGEQSTSSNQISTEAK